MALPAILGVGAALIGARSQSRAAETASQAQSESARLGIREQRRQFNRVVNLLKPYRQAGRSAVGAQLALAGLSGPEAEAEAIARIEGGPAFEALTRQGEEAILSRASATGGLRGGDTQSALAQFRPQVLSQLIEQQYGRLGGLAGLGQASAAGTAAAAQGTGNQISNLLAQQGAATAGGALAQGQIGANLAGQVAGGLGQAFGAGGGFGESSLFNPLFGNQSGLGIGF